MDWDHEWRYGPYDEEGSFGNGYPDRPFHSHSVKTLKLDPPKPQSGCSGVHGSQMYWFDQSRKYQHLGNLCWYHPTDCGRWVPVAGQGMDIYPRTLNESYLDGYSSPNTFKKGDIVRLKTGTAPIMTEIVKGKYFTGEYMNSGTRVVARRIEDIVLHEDYNNTQTEGNKDMADNKTLYEITLTGASGLGQVHYGHYLATNSSGQWVMEEKGTGKIHTVDKADVVEVLPYTISLQFLNDGGRGKNYNYFADKDKYTSGQMFLMDNSFVIVVDVDTKSKLATKDFKPTVELLTKKVG